MYEKTREAKDVSVIVVTYNQEDTIGRTLDSILAQQFDGTYEILVGDDASTDSTGQICREYMERYPDRVKYIRRESNTGLVCNYYDCINQSEGRYIADCAGDDYWVDPTKLQMEFDVMEHDPEISLVHTGWMCVNDKTGNVYPPLQSICLVSQEIVVTPRWELLVPVLSHQKEGMIHLCSAMYRSDLIKQAVSENRQLFIDNLYRCEDLQIMATMAASGKIAYIPRITLHYSVKEESVSHSKDFARIGRQYMSNILITRRFAEFYDVDVSQDLKSYYSDTLDYICAQVYHSGDEEFLNLYRTFLVEVCIDMERSLKRRLYEKIMSNKLLWRMARAVYGARISR